MNDHSPTPSTTAKTPKRRLYRSLLIFVVSIAAACTILMGFTSSNPQAESSATLRILAVETQPVKEQTTFNQQRVFMGKVETLRTSNLGFELPGTLSKVHVQEGESVVANQLLAEIDTGRLEAARAEAEATLLEAKAAMNLAIATLDRTIKAREKNVVSTQQLDEAKRNLDIQKASVSRVEAQIRRIDVDIQKSSMLAPFAGTIAQRFLDEGTVVGASQPVLELLETEKVEIRVGIDREIAASLQIGNPLKATSYGQSFDIAVTRLLPGRDTRTRTVQIIAQPQTNTIDLREGDLVQVTIKTPIEQRGFWLPIHALTENTRGLWSTYIAEPLANIESEGTHQLIKKELKIHTLTENKAYVSGSLNNGDLVLVAGKHRIAPNQRVKLVEPDESTAFATH